MRGMGALTGGQVGSCHQLKKMGVGPSVEMQLGSAFRGGKVRKRWSHLSSDSGTSNHRLVPSCHLGPRWLPAILFTETGPLLLQLLEFLPLQPSTELSLPRPAAQAMRRPHRSSGPRCPFQSGSGRMSPCFLVLLSCGTFHSCRPLITVQPLFDVCPPETVGSVRAGMGLLRSSLHPVSPAVRLTQVGAHHSFVE